MLLTRIVHEDIQLTEVFDGSAYRLVCEIATPQIALQTKPFATLALYNRQSVRCIFSFFICVIDYRNVCPFARKEDCYRPTNTAVTSGNQGDFAL